MYVLRDEDQTRFAYIIDDTVVEKGIDNDCIGHDFSKFYKPQIEITTYKRTTEHYRWVFKESEETKTFETYKLLVPENVIEYDYSFEDGQYFK